MMGDRGKKPQADPKAWTPPSEVTVWLGAIAIVGIPTVFLSIWDLREGRNLVAVISGRGAVALGVLLGWGVVHAVSRHHKDVSWLMGMGGLLGDGVRQPSLLAKFTISLAITLVVCSLGAVLSRRRRGVLAYPPHKTKSPQSGHLLYDADVDGAT